MSGALFKAIKLREWTRRAVAINDVKAIVSLNRRADAAYAKLDPFEAAAYATWCWETLVDDPEMGAFARRALGRE
jgi:hypothetical protein